MDGTEVAADDAMSNEVYAGNYLPMLNHAVKQIAILTDSQRAYDALLRSAYNSDSVLGAWLASRYANLPTTVELSHSSKVGIRANGVYLTGKILQESRLDVNTPSCASPCAKKLPAPYKKSTQRPPTHKSSFEPKLYHMVVVSACLR